MNPSHTTNLAFDAPNGVNGDVLLRDQGQSHRLHEPGLMISSVDPISGQEIADLAGLPYIIDGNMVIYFESAETRQAYRNIPIDHPFGLQDNPDEDGEAEV